MSTTVQSLDRDYALHTLGWKAFQDLCADVAAVVFNRTVEIYRPAQDGGRDAAFLGRRQNSNDDALVSAIQCKFTWAEGKALKLSDLNKEKETIVDLVNEGLAEEYILMTNMSVSGVVAGEISVWLQDLGVRQPHVLGREWLSHQIRSNVRLRAMVPRVYGLGDLGWIIDQRKIEQSREVLAYLGDDLRVYVPTDSHRRAVRALLEHNFVLLLGEPASGKSMIAAILAAMALDQSSGGNRDGQVIRVTDPKDIETNWNPRENDRFFWIDDAFGSNQFRRDYADVWNRLLPTIRTAISSGNRFVLTSRDYIWNEAKRPQNLRVNDLPVLKDGTVVIDLKEMTKDEREQILYNHIKVGDQAPKWKAAVEPFLKQIAAHPRFLPETARRLSKKAFTQNLTASESDLIEFVAEPKQFLIQTLEQLPHESKAAICLIFLHGGRLSSPIPEDDRFEIVNKYFSASRAAIIDALEHLRGNFVLYVTQDGVGSWVYKHPTVADAYAAIVGFRAEMVEIYVRGAKPATILTEVVSGKVSARGSVVMVPKALASVLASRLVELPDSAQDNQRLFSFLFNQIDSEVLQEILSVVPQLLERRTYVWRTLMDNMKLRVHARAHKYNMLSEDLRLETIGRLREAAEEGDAAFIDHEDMFNLFTADEKIDLFKLIKEDVVPYLEGVVERIEDSVSEDDDPATAFENLRATLELLERHFADEESILETINDGHSQIDWAIERLQGRSVEPYLDRDEEITARSPSEGGSNRSIFDDVAY